MAEKENIKEEIIEGENIEPAEDRQKIFWSLLDYYYDRINLVDVTEEEYETCCENKFPLLKTLKDKGLNVFEDSITLAEAIHGYADEEQLKYVGWVMPAAYGYPKGEHQENVKKLKEYYDKNRPSSLEQN
jgi:hypothetical protein